MKYQSFKKISIGVLSTVVALFSFNAFAAHYCGSQKDYYLDRQCNVYYINADGKKVVTGRYGNYHNSGLSFKKDCHGRWYYSDVFGNKVYVSKRCG